MTEKRFTIDFENRVITDTITNEDYSTLIQFKELLNGLNDENEQLKIKNQKQENLINSQNKVIEELENWFDKWGFDVVNYQILDEIMKHFLEDD